MPTTLPARVSREAMTASSPNFAATGYWPISGIPLRTKTMRSEPCGDIIAAVGRLETRAAEPLAVRIGIATGVVVIGDLNREGALREHAVVGETPNLAARLQA